MSQITGSYATNLLVLDGKNWARWCIQMRAIFCYQEVSEVVEDGLPNLEEGASEDQRNAFKLLKWKDCKALCLLHQAVDNAHFERIAGSGTSKEAWETLEKHYAGAAQLKKIKLPALRRQYDLMQMEEGEKVSEFFTRILTQVNAMKACGEKFEECSIVEKILRTMTPRFDHVVVVIEEFGKVEKMKVEELQGSFEVHEQRMNERGTERSSSQVLQAQTSRRSSPLDRSYTKNRGKVFDPRSSLRKSGQSLTSESIEPSSRRADTKNPKNLKKRLDRKRIRCFNCDKIGHFAFECQAPIKNHVQHHV